MSNKLKIGSRCRVIYGANKGRVCKIIEEVNENGCRDFFIEYQNGERDFPSEKNLEPLKPSLDTLFVGDMVVDEAGERRILGICGEAIFISARDKHTVGMIHYWTIEDLKELGYTLKESSAGKAEPLVSGADIKGCECLGDYEDKSLMCDMCKGSKEKFPYGSFPGEERVCKKCVFEDGKVVSLNSAGNCGSCGNPVGTAILSDPITINNKKYNLADVVEKIKSLKEIK